VDLLDPHLRYIDGTITASRGFTVASDKASALLDVREILQLLRNQSDVEIFLEWEVTE
jgi:hypothetical protein